VKIVLASRPEAPFESVLGVGLRCPTLRLEALTKNDISSYVAARLWKNPSLRHSSGTEESLAYEIESYVIDNPKEVFLWVTLVMDIVIDGMDHHDDIQTIRELIAALPAELDDLFSHILLRRISDHHRTETFRCLFMVLEWHRNHPEGLLPLAAVNVGQQAISYEVACSLAAIHGEDARRNMVNMENRLRARCHGLLESYHTSRCENSSGSQSTVTFLHRTLLDYLHQHKWVNEMFCKHSGGDFDVFTAMMAGLIAYLQSAMLIGTGEVSQLMDDIVEFNTKAEQSTGQSRSELLWIAEERAAALTPGSPRRRQISVSVGCPNMALLAKTISVGAALFLREQIERYGHRSPEMFFALLEHAVPPSSGAGPNIAAITLLFELGADPTRSYNGLDICSKTLKKLIEDVCREYSSPARIVQHLDTLNLLAELTPDLKRCQTVTVDNRNASQVIRKFVLEEQCCSGRPLVDCHCPITRALKPPAMAVLELVEVHELVEVRGSGGKLSPKPWHSLWGLRKFRSKR
jgi:hypothetical protein